MPVLTQISIVYCKSAESAPSQAIYVKHKTKISSKHATSNAFTPLACLPY